MTTFNIASGPADGWSGIGGEAVETVQPGSYWYIGSNDGTTKSDWAGIYRSTGIVAGSQILTASMLLTRHINDTGGTQVDIEWWGFAVDSPSDFNAAHTHRVSDHHTRTSAFALSTIQLADLTHTSPSLAAIIQEIVDRPAFSGDLGLAIRSVTTDASFWPMADFSTPGTTPALSITWTSKPKPRLAPQQRMSW